MNSVLLAAVLSGSPDYDGLFAALSWPEESSPRAEQLEALTAFIKALGPVLEDSASPPVQGAGRRCIQDRVEAVLWRRCLPLLSQLSGEGEPCRERTAAVCRLLAVCVSLCGPDASRRVALTVLPSLQLPEEGSPSPGRLSVEVAGEVLAALVPSLSSDEQLAASTVSSALSCIRKLPDLQVSRVMSRVLVPLLGSCSGVGLVLEDLCCWHSSTRTPAVTQRALLCLTALSDHLLKAHSPHPAPDPRVSVQFWRMIQDGLTHRDNLSRKRALYLLKRCAALSEQEGSHCPPSLSEPDESLFKWSPDHCKVLREFWEDYVLVMETLEENQVHVVRPVLNRIDTLVQTTVNDSQGQGLFHPSWLLCVYQRMFHSENKSLMREGVCHLLELQVLQEPAFASAFSQFIVGPFMDILSETSLFHRAIGQKVGDCPELGAKLEVFLTRFFSSLPLEQRSTGEFVRTLIHASRVIFQ